MKYVIEIEDVPFSKVRIDADNGAQNINLYRAKGFNALVFDKHGLDKLTPLDKALNEHYQRGLEEGKKQAKVQAHLDVCHDIDRVAHGNYQKGLDDAWETVREILACDYHRRYAIFDVDNSYEVVTKFTASEAIAKLKAYEEQQKADAEIKVGNEVEAYSGRAIVFGTFTDKIGNKICNYWYPSEDRFDRDKVKNLKKTGKHFPQVAELLKAMKEGAE